MVGRMGLPLLVPCRALATASSYEVGRLEHTRSRARGGVGRGGGMVP